MAIRIGALNLSPAQTRLAVVGGGIVIAIIGMVAGYLVWQALQPTNGSADQATATRVIGEIGTIYDLPTDETPSVLKMQNPGQLEGQEFYKKAQKGDYVLIYAKNELAIIYRDETRKLINVDHVAIGNGAGSQTQK